MENETLAISVEEAGRLLGISRGLAYSLAREGKLPVVRLGKRILVPKAALATLMNTGAQPVGAGGRNDA